MDFTSMKDYLSILAELSHNPNISDLIKSKLKGYVEAIVQSDQENNYNKPLVWIGTYIALASLICILAMVADLLHGLRSRKLWFPCKYFTINVASLAVIAVAMKFPVDLSGPMPGVVEQVAKLESMAFMCTMMANLLPCLETMDSKVLLTNITALGVLVIILVVNVCIQMHVTYPKGRDKDLQDVYRKVYPRLIYVPINIPYATIATIYVTLLLVLFIIHVCCSLAILASKQIIEPKYQQGHETASEDLQPPLLG